MSHGVNLISWVLFFWVRWSDLAILGLWGGGDQAHFFDRLLPHLHMLLVMQIAKRPKSECKSHFLWFFDQKQPFWLTKWSRIQGIIDHLNSRVIWNNPRLTPPNDVILKKLWILTPSWPHSDPKATKHPSPRSPPEVEKVSLSLGQPWQWGSGYFRYSVLKILENGQEKNPFLPHPPIKPACLHQKVTWPNPDPKGVWIF